MEIEKKFLVSELPEDLDHWKASEIEQGYLCQVPWSGSAGWMISIS